MFTAHCISIICVMSSACNYLCNVICVAYVTCIKFWFWNIVCVVTVKHR